MKCRPPRQGLVSIHCGIKLVGNLTGLQRAIRPPRLYDEAVTFGKDRGDIWHHISWYCRRRLNCFLFWSRENITLYVSVNILASINIRDHGYAAPEFHHSGTPAEIAVLGSPVLQRFLCVSNLLQPLLIYLGLRFLEQAETVHLDIAGVAEWHEVALVARGWHRCPSARSAALPVKVVFIVNQMPPLVCAPLWDDLGRHKERIGMPSALHNREAAAPQVLDLVLRDNFADEAQDHASE